MARDQQDHSLLSVSTMEQQSEAMPMKSGIGNLLAGLKSNIFKLGAMPDLINARHRFMITRDPTFKWILVVSIFSIVFLTFSRHLTYNLAR